MRGVERLPIFYVLRTGCSWWILLHNSSPRATVRYFFRFWRLADTEEPIYEVVHAANLDDRDSKTLALAGVNGHFPRLELI